MNKGKLTNLEKAYNMYTQDVQFFIDKIISKELSHRKLISSKELPSNIIKHSVWKAIAYKEASSIVSVTLKKNRKKVFKQYKKLYAKCIKKGIHKKFTNKRFSELNINYYKRLKIAVKNVQMIIDSRVLSIKSNVSKFDEFIGIMLPFFEENSSFKRKFAVKINVPIKYHRQHKKFESWTRCNSIRIGKYTNGDFYIALLYEKEDPVKKEIGDSIGVDLGYKKLISDSNGNFYGKHLEDIYKRLAGKKRGSKKYKKLLSYKKNETNRVCNTLDVDNLKTMICEDLKYVKYDSILSRSMNNKLQYWSYRQVLDKLARLAEEKGFHFLLVDPTYTSQICSECGILDKTSRQGEVYHCKSCGCLIDADTNGARNILQRGLYGTSLQAS